jgi:hypothetical protein
MSRRFQFSLGRSLEAVALGCVAFALHHQAVLVEHIYVSTIWGGRIRSVPFSLLAWSQDGHSPLSLRPSLQWTVELGSCGGSITSRRHFDFGVIQEILKMKRTISVSLLGLMLTFAWSGSPHRARAEEKAADPTQAVRDVDPALLKSMAASAKKMSDAADLTYDDNYVWSQRRLYAERALAKTAAEDIAAVRAHRERMKLMMLTIRFFYLNGAAGGTTEQLLASKYYLAEADVWVAAAKYRGNAPPLKKVTMTFRGPKGMKIQWDENNDSDFDSKPLACPVSHDFLEGRMYFLQFTGADNLELDATLDLIAAPQQALLVEISEEEVTRIAGNESLHKVFLQTAQRNLAVENEWTDSQESEAEHQGQAVAVLRVTGKDW